MKTLNVFTGFAARKLFLRVVTIRPNIWVLSSGFQPVIREKLKSGLWDFYDVGTKKALQLNYKISNKMLRRIVGCTINYFVYCFILDIVDTNRSQSQYNR